MGSPNITKKIKQYRLLTDVVEEAVKKFPGLNKMFSIYQYNLLVKEIHRVKREEKYRADIHLSQLIVDAIDYYFKDGRN
jgi:hypothetical protein